MYYKFPIIKHINDVLPYVKDRPEFIIRNNKFYTVINYQIVMNDTFPDVIDNNAAIRRECRGIIFDNATGNIISRPYHKFFNVNEREETKDKFINLNETHNILEKLDGSMIRPFITSDGVLRWGTKMGETDVSMQVEEFVKINTNYIDFAKIVCLYGFTPIFEWCSNKQKIVVDHPEDKLVLTAIRHNSIGEYHSYEKLVEIGGFRNIPVVNKINFNNSVKELVEHTKNIKQNEGYVIAFDNGMRYKIKSDWYLARHNAKEAINFEKNVISLIVNDQIDDVLPLLTEDEQRKINLFRDDLMMNISSFSVKLFKFFNNLKSENIDRKQFAIEVLPNLDKTEKAFPSFIFSMYDGKNKKEDVYEMVLTAVKKSCKSASSVDKARPFFGFIRYADYMRMK